VAASAGRGPDLDRVPPDAAEQIARRHYGVSGTAQRLAAEHADAFRIDAADGSVRLLKIAARAADGASPPGPGLETAVLLQLAATAPGLPVQRVIPALDGQPEVILGPRLARMTSWLDGPLLGRGPAADVGPAATALRRDIGGTLARLNLALRGFRHPQASRTHRWDLQRLTELRPLLADLPDSAADARLRADLAGCLDRFDAVAAPRLARTPVQVIHADFHGENLLSDGRRVTGILDFGDALAGPVAMDVGIAACYQLGGGPDVLAPALDVVAGYHAADPLGPDDLSLAAEFLVARLAARVILSQWHARREPANQAYLLRRTPQAAAQLAALSRLGPERIAARLRAACPPPSAR
jgi:hydroxylysine kinase